MLILLAVCNNIARWGLIYFVQWKLFFNCCRICSYFAWIYCLYCIFTTVQL